MQKQFENETFTFTFTNRETYVAWRAEWRAEYAELTANIREAKAKINALGKSLKDTLTEKEIENIIVRMGRIQNQLHTDRAEAGMKMRQRAAATAFKNASMAASKQAA